MTTTCALGAVLVLGERPADAGLHAEDGKKFGVTRAAEDLLRRRRRRSGSA